MEKSTVFYENVEEETKKNDLYRKVVYTGKQQFVYMSIEPNDGIHLETHPDHDQFIRIEEGEGVAIIDDKEHKLFDGIGIIIPAGCKHEIKNTSSEKKLKLYSIYSPPEHDKDRIDEINPDKNNIVETNKNLQKKYLKYKKKYFLLKEKF
jgi:hypothetical protein